MTKPITPPKHPPRAAAGSPVAPAHLLTRRRVMIVTNEPMNRALIEAILRAEPDFDIVMVDDPARMPAAITDGVDLIVLDLALSQPDLMAICRAAKEQGRDLAVPILMLTGTASSSSAERGKALEAGADDVLGKPFHRNELTLRIRSLLRLKSLHDELREAEELLMALCRVVESKIHYTPAHSERVAAYADRIGRRIGLSGDDLKTLRRAALMHDIGKAAIPDLILNKPGALTPDESLVLRQRSVLPTKPADTAGTRQIIPIIRHHHERVDGTGYPDQLVGSEIPLGARILAIADAYDAMMSQRPYRGPMSPERAAAQLRAGAGTQWDADLVDAFFAALDDALEENGRDAAKSV